MEAVVRLSGSKAEIDTEALIAAVVKAAHEGAATITAEDVAEKLTVKTKDNAMAKHLRVTEPTQVRNPRRALIRTIFAAAVSLAAITPFIVNALGVATTGGVWAAVLAVAGAITRVMALPGVNAWIESYVPWLAPEKTNETIS